MEKGKIHIITLVNVQCDSNFFNILHIVLNKKPNMLNKKFLKSYLDEYYNTI
jgi:type IV secretory pathway VirB3-like protein